MRIQLIRNATLRVQYGGHLILVDPFLGAQGSVRSFAGIAPNPTVELPVPVAEILAGVEMVLVSHLHPDHFDEAAAALLPKELPLFCQPGDEERIRAHGFTAVMPITDSHEWQGISLTRTPGQHGSGEWADRMGQVSGFVWRAAGEPTVYWMGDTIWYEPVQVVVAQVQPDVIVTHSGGARFGQDPPIVMDVAMTTAVCQAAPQATVIAVHMEALDHCPVSRAELRQAATEQGISAARLRIPADGEWVAI